MLQLDDAVLRSLGLSFAHINIDGRIVRHGGPGAGLLPIDAVLTDLIPLFVGIEDEMVDLAAGHIDPINWPNMALPQLASNHIYDLRLGPAVTDGDQPHLLLTLVDRGLQAKADREVMQARNDAQLLETRLIEARESAELANQTKDQLVLLLRDHIREPLGLHLSHARQLAKETGGLHRRLSAMAGASVAEGERLLHMLDSLLDLTGAAAGALSPNAEETSADEALRLFQSGIYDAATLDEIGEDRLRVSLIQADWTKVSLSLDAPRFQHLIQVLSAYVAARLPQVHWSGPSFRGDFFMLNLDLADLSEDQELAACVTRPATYLHSGGPNPGLMLIALLLRSMGLACRFDRDQARLGLALPILPPEA